MGTAFIVKLLCLFGYLVVLRAEFYICIGIKETDRPTDRLSQGDPKTLFLAIFLRPQRCARSPAEVGPTRTVDACTALHALDCSLRSPHPLFRNGLTNKHSLTAACGGAAEGGWRPEDEDRRTPSTPFSLSAPPATHSLFTTQRRKGRRERTCVRARYRGRLKKFSHFRPLSLPSLLSLSVPSPLVLL